MISLLNKNKKLNKINNEIIRNYSNNSNNERYWKKLLFTDLHVSSKSLDRTIEVLKKVRELSCLNNEDGDSNKAPTPVVFLGDFWHQRNILHVRHIDQLLKEFEQWKRFGIDTVFIPGNHDQVSIDGSVHGIQMFSLFPNFKVATDPIIDQVNGFAYLPWRETKEDQKQLFTNLSTINLSPSTSIHNEWTVFAHAEVKGAISNGGYKSNGKFEINDLAHNSNGSNNIRSCYLGHYHKRQQISNNFWYIGSPYQQNFGEMNDPHGVAFVDSNRIEPYFVDFNDLPRHHKLYFPFDLSKIPLIKSRDIVEIKSTKDHMKSNQYINSINSLPPFIDLRRVMINNDSTTNQESNTISIIKRKDKQPSSPLQLNSPINKFKLEDFLETYINDKVIMEDLEETEEMRKQLLYLGKNILSMVKEPSIVPMGRKVQIQKIKIKDFCGLGGELELNLTDEQMINKMVMIRGEMGSGKSTIFEALVWCLYGNTSPKKQSTSSSSIKGDEVINDQAKQTSVTVTLMIDDCKPIEITRSKKRTSGAKISINGLTEQDAKQGVLDQQNLLNNIIGLDYDSFRMSIYLGQGSISNFVTDTDKRKKELLSRIFSLGLCIPAAKQSKEIRKKKESEINEIIKKISNLESSLNTWESIDFEKQSQDWYKNKTEKLSKLNQELSNDLLQFEQLKSSLESNIGNSKELKEKSNEIYKIIKSLENEKDKIQRDLTRSSIQLNEKSTEIKYKNKQLQFEIKSLQDSIKHLNQHLIENKCSQCGQLLINDGDTTSSKNSTKQLLEKEIEKLNKLEIEINENQIIESKFKSEIDQSKVLFDQLKKDIQNQLNEKQIELQQINKSIEEFSKIEINLNYLKESINNKENQIAQLKDSQDPHNEKILEKQQNIDKLVESIKINNKLLNTNSQELKKYQFWEDGFSANGLPMMALHSVVKEVESYANEFLSILSKGKLFTTLSIENQDELQIEIFELSKDGKLQPRSLYQLSGGQRRCLELSYSPFALSEVIFNHSGSRVTTIIIDELTNHLDTTVKPIICDVLRNLQEKDSIIVIDHDISVQSEFDQVFNLEKSINNNNLNLKLIQ